MKVAVFGPRGMLGRAVVNALRQRGHQPVRLDWNIASPRFFERFASRKNLAAAINCAGVIPAKLKEPGDMVSTNALGPMNLSAYCSFLKIHLVHVSTDCVFSGSTEGRIDINARPDAVDLYGRTKILGEAISDRAAVVRTSFIGPDHGLMRWLLSAPANSTVEGWLKAYWTGSSVHAVARGLVEIAESGETGLMHLATERVYNKCEIVEALIAHLRLPLQVRRVTQPYINHALMPTHILPPFEEVLSEL
jgi:dTDP-4-dehydrorhamnose reductase